jgi:hypothetical protein
MFAGYVGLGSTLAGAFLVKNSQESPQNPDQPPTYKVYGPARLMQHGTGIASKLDGDTGLYQYTVSADPSNGYEAGVCYRVFITAVVLGVTVAYEQSFIVT